MTNTTRRRFLMAVGAVAGAAVPVIAQSTPPTMALARSHSGLVHTVYFWLKRPTSGEDKAELIAGLKALEAIPSIRSLYIGVPASTEQRDVVDSSFHVSEMMMFDDVAGQNAYQEHPLHQQFVENCGHLWQRVVVYDSQLV